MTTDSNSSHKTNLLRVLEEAGDRTGRLQDQAQNVVQEATRSRDLAESIHNVVIQAPDDSVLPTQTWVRLTNAWKAYNDQVMFLSHALVGGTTFSASSQAAAFTTTTVSLVMSDWIDRPTAPTAALETLLHRPSLVAEVRVALQSFGLDRSHDSGRSPLELLDEANLALIRPGGPLPSPTGVMLSARESINAALAALLRRRTQQEPTSTPAAKILSIGNQCGLPNLSSGHFERIGSDLAELLDRLSGAKQSAVTQADVTKLFDSTLQFHKAFLGSLDLNKLRPPAIL